MSLVLYSLICDRLRLVFLLCDVVCFFFFKQKTAYEMRISDWSSDVCSSDLRGFSFQASYETAAPHSPDALRDGTSFPGDRDGLRYRKAARACQLRHTGARDSPRGRPASAPASPSAPTACQASRLARYESDSATRQRVRCRPAPLRSATARV